MNGCTVSKQELMQHINQGLTNLKQIQGCEYKKYIIYAIFDYICKNREHMHCIGKQMAEVIEYTLNKFIEDMNRETDSYFRQKCNCYKIILKDYFEWGASAKQ